MLKNVMQLHLHATKTQIMDLGSEYYLVCGENWLSHLFVQTCMKNKSIYEQALWEVRQETVGHNWSSINAVVKLKRGQDGVDKYHIHKVNDKKWNENLNFCYEEQQVVS